MRKLFILLLAIFAGIHAYGQQNFVEGYIVTATQDTLKGWIDYQDRDKTPTHIEFRQQKEGTTQLYNLKDVRSMKVADDYFVVMTVALEMSPHQLQDLSYSPEPEMMKRTALFRVLVKGIANLYYVKDERGKKHFLIERDTVLEELIYKQYKVRDAGKTMISEVNTYKGQLSYYFQDCPEVTDKLSKLTYKQTAITQLFEVYNHCMGAEGLMVKQKEKLILEFRAISGASLSGIKFYNDLTKTLPYLDFETSWNPTVGISLNTVVPNNRQRWSFCNDIMYTLYRVEATKITRKELYYFDVSYMKLYTMARYQYPGTTVRPFINAGWTGALALKADHGVLKEYTLNGNTYIHRSEVLTDFRKHEQGWTIGSGLFIKRLLTEVRYERANGMSPYRTLRSTVNRWYFLVGYHF